MRNIVERVHVCLLIDSILFSDKQKTWASIVIIYFLATTLFLTIFFLLIFFVVSFFGVATGWGFSIRITLMWHGLLMKAER